MVCSLCRVFSKKTDLNTYLELPLDVALNKDSNVSAETLDAN